MIPNLEIEKLVTEDGSLHPTWQNFFDVLIRNLQNTLSNEGIKVPQQPTTTITELNTAQSLGALLYDETTHELKVNINGTFKTVQVM